MWWKSLKEVNRVKCWLAGVWVGLAGVWTGIREGFYEEGDVRVESRSTIRGKLHTELGMEDEFPRKDGVWHAGGRREATVRGAWPESPIDGELLETPSRISYLTIIIGSRLVPKMIISIWMSKYDFEIIFSFIFPHQNLKKSFIFLELLS